MLDLHKNLRTLVLTSLLVYVGLSIFVAVVPAYQLQEVRPLPQSADLTDAQRNGLRLYVAENCMVCHTQQVRNIEMDMTWGNRPSIPSDYYYSKQRMDFWRQSPSLLGSERTGPDLTNVGSRQPGEEWHLLHLYNPRIVVKESVMPGYPWLFEEKEAAAVKPGEKVVPVPPSFQKHQGRKVVATAGALDLVAYLQQLTQSALPGEDVREFIPAARKTPSATDATADADGETLYMNTCAACHQANGGGLAGAFPPLAGSAIVQDENPETLIRIILQGYDARAEYGMMPGFGEQLSDADIAAIATHERSSWGNNAAAVSADDVKKIREYALGL